VPDGDPFAFFQLQSRIIAFVQKVSKNTVSSKMNQTPDAIISATVCRPFEEMRIFS